MKQKLFSRKTQLSAMLLHESKAIAVVVRIIAFALLMVAGANFAWAVSYLDNTPPPKYDDSKTNYYLQQLKGKRLKLASEVKKSLPPHMLDFVNKYEQVRLYKNEDMLAELIHPASKACEEDYNTEYFAQIRYFYLTEKLPAGYRLEILPVREDKQWELKNKLGTPLPPTHVMYIEFKIADNEDGSIEIEGWQRFLREETFPEPRMYELVRCPTREDMKIMREQANPSQ